MKVPGNPLTQFGLGGNVIRAIAQLGSAPALGAGCRQFKSGWPDHLAHYSSDFKIWNDGYYFSVTDQPMHSPNSHLPHQAMQPNQSNQSQQLKQLKQPKCNWMAYTHPAVIKRGMIRHKHGLIGLLLTIAGGSLWGINATVSKVLMSDYHTSPLWLACVREIAAGLIFLIAALISDRHKVVAAVKDRHSWPWFIAISLTTVLLVQISYLSAIKWTNSGTATVLQSLNLLFVLVWVCVHDKRLPHWPETVGVILAFIGTMLDCNGR